MYNFVVCQLTHYLYIIHNTSYKKIVIIRHGESEWNQKNLITGWVDVELSEKGKAEAKRAGELMKEAGLDFDVCYTSYLKRSINTQQIALKVMEREWLPVINVSSMNSEQCKLFVNGPLYIDARLLWKQAIGSNCS